MTTRVIVGLALGRLVRAIPLLITLACGMAWWTVKRRKPEGRRWAIAASISTLLVGLLLAALATYFYTRFNWAKAKGGPQGLLGLLLFTVPFLVSGIAGLVAFWPRDSVEQMPRAPAKPPRIAGDGTSAAMDVFAFVLQVGGFVLAMRWWRQWSLANGMPLPRFGWLQIAVAALLATVLHEFGHALVGRAAGMRLRAFVVGPFQWRIRDGRWKFQFIPGKFFAAGGATALVPLDPQQRDGSQICMIAAGPAVNLITGLIALYYALLPKSLPNWQAWDFLILFATVSLLVFAGNLLPFRPEANYSDGARIYQILSGGPLADYNRAMSMAASSLITPLRPRDYDIGALQHTACAIQHGTQGMMLRLLSHTCYLDRGQISEAAAVLAEAENIYRESALNLHGPLHTVFVFGCAYAQRNAAAARQWWDRMHEKKPTEFNSDYWRAKSALHWIEGDLEEANTAWNKCNDLAQQLPQAGAYEFDRYCCSLLRRAIDALAASAAGVEA